MRTAPKRWSAWRRKAGKPSSRPRSWKRRNATPRRSRSLAKSAPWLRNMPAGIFLNQGADFASDLLRLGVALRLFQLLGLLDGFPAFRRHALHLFGAVLIAH